MINCDNSETYYSAYYDQELENELSGELSTHFISCKSCKNEYEVYEKAMDSMNHLNFGIDANSLSVPIDFTQNVMAQVRVSSPKRQEAGSWKIRAVGFVALFVAYAFYMISVSPVNKSVDAELDMTRSLAIFNLFLIGMSLSFIFFTREFVGVNSKLLSRLSASYKQVTSNDVNLLRYVGASIFLGVLVGKFIF